MQGNNYLDYIKAKYNKHIKYSDKTIDSRMQNVKNFLYDIEDFFIEYNNNYLDVNLNSKKSLSIFNPISKILGKLTDYLLSAIDIIDDNFHTESNFNKKLLKEIPLSEYKYVTGESFANLLDILKIKNQAIVFKNAKQTARNNYIMSDEYNRMVSEYNDALVNITNKIKNNNYDNRYKYTKMKKDIINDINIISESNNKTVNTNNHNNIKNYYSLFNINEITLHNLFNFKCLGVSLQDVRSFRMLCVLKEDKSYNDHNIIEIVEDFNNILKKICITRNGKLILKYLSKGYTYDHIALKLSLQKSYVSKLIKDMIVSFKKYYNLEKTISQIKVDNKRFDN